MRHVSYKSTGHGFRRCMIIGFLRDWARLKWARRKNWREEKIIDFFILFDSQENHFPPNYVNLRENLKHYVCPGYISYRARNSNLRWFFGLLFFLTKKKQKMQYLAVTQVFSIILIFIIWAYVLFSVRLWQHRINNKKSAHERTDGR